MYKKSYHPSNPHINNKYNIGFCKKRKANILFNINTYHQTRNDLNYKVINIKGKISKRYN